MCVIAAFIGCLWSSPAAFAEAVGIRDAPDAKQIALAGPDVLVARELADGAVQLDAVPRAGGAPRVLFTVPAASELSPYIALSSSATQVALLVTRETVRGENVRQEIYAGPPSGPLRMVWSLPLQRARAWEALLADVDATDTLILAERNLTYQLRAWTLDSASVRTRVPWVTRSFAPVAIAGEHAAVLARRPRRVAVVDRRDGHVRIRRRVGARAGIEADVAPDGRLVTAVRAGLLTLRAGESPRTIPRTAGLVKPVFAGAAIAAAYETRDDYRPVLIGPDDTQRVLGGPTASLRDITADAEGVAWLANGCVRYAPISGPPPAPPTDAACPQTEIGLYTIDKSWVRDHRIRVRVHCIATPTDACRGTLLLKDFDNQRVVASGPFTVPAGARRRVPVTLSDQAIAVARRKYGFNIDADIPNGRIGPGCCGASEISVKIP